MKKDIVTVEELMKILENENLTEIDYECNEYKISLKRAYKQEKTKVADVHGEQVKPLEAPKIEKIEIVSQGIGNFYGTEKNGESKLKIGAVIKEGEVIGEIRAMGVNSPIISTGTGEILEILVEDGGIVDYNKVVLVLKK